MAYTKALAISTSDTVDLAPYTSQQRLTDGIYVGVTGNIVAVLADGTTVTLKGAVAGSVVPIAARRVNSTNTTATDLVALYAQ